MLCQSTGVPKWVLGQWGVHFRVPKWNRISVWLTSALYVYIYIYNIYIYIYIWVSVCMYPFAQAEQLDQPHWFEVCWTTTTAERCAFGHIGLQISESAECGRSRATRPPALIRRFFDDNHCWALCIRSHRTTDFWVGRMRNREQKGSSSVLIMTSYRREFFDGPSGDSVPVKHDLN